MDTHHTNAYEIRILVIEDRDDFGAFGYDLHTIGAELRAGDLTSVLRGIVEHRQTNIE